MPRVTLAATRFTPIAPRKALDYHSRIGGARLVLVAVLILALGLVAVAATASVLTISLVHPTVDPDLSAVTNGPNPVAVVTGQSTLFEASATLDGNNLGSWDAQYWQWDFGDGTALDSSNPTQHTYQADGIYNASVTLNYGPGQQMLLFTVVAGPGTEPPPTAAIVFPDAVAVGATANARAGRPRLDDAALSDENGGRVADCTPVHITASPGAMEVVQLCWKVDDEADWHTYDFTTDEGEMPPGLSDAWTPDPDGDGWWAYWASWCSLNTHHWQWQAQIRFMTGPLNEWGMPTPEDIWTDPVTVQPYNTVTQDDMGGGVILHHGSESHDIYWMVDHLSEDNPTFDVWVSIYPLASAPSMNPTPVATLHTSGYTLDQEGLSCWDGKINNPDWPHGMPGMPGPGDDAPVGVYTYRVYAEHDGMWMCADQDKSSALTTTVNDGQFYYTAKNTQTGKLTVIVRYTLSEAASDCTIRFYGPDLSPLGELDHQASGNGTHWSDKKDIAGLATDGSILQPLYCVVSATESEERAATNRGGDAKPALESGCGTLQLMDFGLRSVSFTNVATPVARDYPNAQGNVWYYTGPQWKDNTSPLNFQADDGSEDPLASPPAGQAVSDRKYPVCYVGGSHVTCSVTVAVPGYMISGDVLIRGASTFLTFPATPLAQAPPASGGDVTQSITSSEALPPGANDFSPLGITWSVSGDGGATWRVAGASENEMFVTLAAPQCAIPFRTVLYLATAGGGTDPDSCFAATWSAFAGPANVDGWNTAAQSYTRPLHYYANGFDLNNRPDETSDYLILSPTGSGNCASWADLLRQCACANGITDVQLTKITPAPGCDMFGVKNLVYVPTAIDDPPLPPFRYPQAQVDISVAGLPGQNTNPPAEKLFAAHYIDSRGAFYYDPSYGVSVSAGSDPVAANAYTLGNIAAWGKQLMYLDPNTNVLTNRILWTPRTDDGVQDKRLNFATGPW